MTGQVVDITLEVGIRRRLAAFLASERPDDRMAVMASSRYGCGRCGTQAFRLRSDGSVQCDDCEQTMGNLVTTHKEMSR